MKIVSLNVLKGSLRRAATPRRADGAAAPRAVNPLPMVAGIRKWKNVFIGGRPRSREASAVQRATLPVRPLMENLSNMRPKATAVKQHVPRR
ncbi:MAG: hypothetical protein LBQ54_15360 [Planctomycetaceae bacterium]|nr:hypothetical protein [Planctomycetaceae bacterium]